MLEYERLFVLFNYFAGFILCFVMKNSTRDAKLLKVNKMFIILITKTLDTLPKMYYIIGVEFSTLPKQVLKTSRKGGSLWKTAFSVKENSGF